MNGAINKQTDEDSPSKPAKPAPKKQCPYCLRKFPANLLNDHKKTCTCRIVTCKYCGKGRMARQIATHEKFCDKRPKDSDAKATNKEIAKKVRQPKAFPLRVLRQLFRMPRRSHRKRGKAPTPPVLARPALAAPAMMKIS